MKKELISLLKQYIDVFAWSYDDMPGLSTDIVSHRLPTNPACLPVKQKTRKFKPDLSLKIKEKVTKQIKANVVRVTTYPTWLDNTMLVLKKDGKIRICMDYRDLNKSSSKDDFPLQNIHILIDNCAKHELQSFINYFMGYHHILMNEDDAEKIAFITLWRVYCYRDAAIGWTEECQKGFDKIKEYLSKPRILVPPELGKPLLLYLSVRDNVFGYVLGQHDDTGRREQAIYYLSKKFTPCEARYTLLERTCCVLTWVAQKLWHYLSAYTTYLITKMDPLKYIFQKPMSTGKLKAVKGQALADYFAENPVDQDYMPLNTYFPNEEVLFVGEDISEPYDGWIMFFDGAVNFKGVGIGAVLVSEIVQHYSISAKIRFPCTNNIT
ncbi:uncharacterized protein LOC124899472 [Capsicum annuum]|uniref:uncharacterized protein LOC124899472 n=1 Tax=Capsicum annuum TaxID=4072 RepID=UPI001FB18DD1|nr:uncharacterized protein LOC124899472 [Capsicum annuum]